MIALFLSLYLSFGITSFGMPAPQVANQAPQAANQPDQSYAFVNVSVIPMTGEGLLRGHTVIVQGDRIVDLGLPSQVSVPEGAERIDGTGRFLLPGLAEMHGHIPPPTQPDSEIENVLFLYVANGITTVRGMLGYENQLDLKERAVRGEIVSPNLYLAGPSFSANSISSPEEAERRVRKQASEGWDLLKIHPGLTRDEFDAVARTARETGMRFGGHVPADVGIAHALDEGQETFDHLDGYETYVVDDTGNVDENLLREIVRRTVEAGAWVVPTMELWETILGANDLHELISFPELRYTAPAQVRSWTQAYEGRVANPSYDAGVAARAAASRLRILSALYEGGVRVLMGTDAPQQFSVPGFSLHREMRTMEEAGMSRYEVLKSGTWNVGAYFANEDTFGTIQPGARADLLLLEANPLDDLSNVSRRVGVMVRGRWLGEEAIQERLAEIASSYGSGTE